MIYGKSYNPLSWLDMTWEQRTTYLNAKYNWHRWFAWYPICLNDGRIAWLQNIERKVTFERFHYEQIWIKNKQYRIVV